MSQKVTLQISVDLLNQLNLNAPPAKHHKKKDQSATETNKGKNEMKPGKSHYTDTKKGHEKKQQFEQKPQKQNPQRQNIPKSSNESKIKVNLVLEQPKPRTEMKKDKQKEQKYNKSKLEGDKKEKLQKQQHHQQRQPRELPPPYPGHERQNPPPPPPATPVVINYYCSPQGPLGPYPNYPTQGFQHFQPAGLYGAPPPPPYDPRPTPGQYSNNGKHGQMGNAAGKPRGNQNSKQGFPKKYPTTVQKKCNINVTLEATSMTTLS